MHPNLNFMGTRVDSKPLPNVMWERRATRHFLPDPIPDEDLAIMLGLASQAPSGYNLQPWRFVIVRDPENRRRLRAAALDQQKITEAPVVVVAFGRKRTWAENVDEIFCEAAVRGSRDISNLEQQKKAAIAFVSKLQPEVWLNRHVMIAFTCLMLAAESMGWDTAPMEGFDPAAVCRVLHLPDDAEVVALLAIGRRRGSDSPHPGRLGIERLVYSENFGEPWTVEAPEDNQVSYE